MTTVNLTAPQAHLCYLSLDTQAKRLQLFHSNYWQYCNLHHIYQCHSFELLAAADSQQCQGRIQRLKKGGGIHIECGLVRRVWDAVVCVRALAAFPGLRAFVASLQYMSLKSLRTKLHI